MPFTNFVALVIVIIDVNGEIEVLKKEKVVIFIINGVEVLLLPDSYTYRTSCTARLLWLKVHIKPELFVWQVRFRSSSRHTGNKVGLSTHYRRFNKYMQDHLI